MENTMRQPERRQDEISITEAFFYACITGTIEDSARFPEEPTYEVAYKGMVQAFVDHGEEAGMQMIFCGEDNMILRFIGEGALGVLLTKFEEDNACFQYCWSEDLRKYDEHEADILCGTVDVSELGSQYIISKSIDDD